MEAKEKRNSTLYVRVTEINKQFVVFDHKAKNYFSESEYVDALITKERERTGWKPPRTTTTKKAAAGKKTTGRATVKRKATTKNHKKVPMSLVARAKAKTNASHAKRVR